MSDERPQIERVLDLALYAPVGVALTVCAELPKRIKQRRQALENRVQLARFIGQIAVQTGQRELAKRIEQQRLANAAQGGDRRVEIGTTSASAVVSPPALTIVADLANRSPKPEHLHRGTGSSQPVAAVPTARELPISNYESLAAIHVVERLRSMTVTEIELIRRFEAANRSRRTILAKIDQLQGR